MSPGSVLKKPLCWRHAVIERRTQRKKKVTSRHLGSHGQDTDWRSDGLTWQKEMMAKQRQERLTSDLILLARRAMLQVSWGCTDCRWGRSWGVYSLSFVSLVKVAFCKDQRTNVSTRAQVNRNKSQHMHRYFYNTFFLYLGRGQTHAAHLLTLRKHISLLKYLFNCGRPVRMSALLCLFSFQFWS